MSTRMKPPTSFWIVAVLAVIWNIMGVYQYYLGTFELESFRDMVSAEEFAIVEAMPAWYGIVFAIAVFSGLVASILLLARKKFAVPLFAISLITVLIIEFYWLLGTEIIAVSGPKVAIMPIIVIAIAIFLYFYSKGAKQKAWIN